MSALSISATTSVTGAVTLGADSQVSVAVGGAVTALSTGPYRLTVAADGSLTTVLTQSAAGGALILSGSGTFAGAIALNGANAASLNALTVLGPSLTGDLSLGAPNAVNLTAGTLTSIRTGGNQLTLAVYTPLACSISANGTGSIILDGTARTTVTIDSIGAKSVVLLGGVFAGAITHSRGPLALNATVAGFGGTVQTASDVIIGGSVAVSSAINPLASLTVNVLAGAAYTGSIVSSANVLTLNAVAPAAATLVQSLGGSLVLSGPGPFIGAVSLQGGAAALSLTSGAVLSGVVSLANPATINIDSTARLDSTLTTGHAITFTCATGGLGSIGSSAALISLTPTLSLTLNNIQVMSGAIFPGALTVAFSLSGAVLSTGVLLPPASSVAVVTNSTIGAISFATLTVARNAYLALSETGSAVNTLNLTAGSGVVSTVAGATLTAAQAQLYPADVPVAFTGYVLMSFLFDPAGLGFVMCLMSCGLLLCVGLQCDGGRDWSLCDRSAHRFGSDCADQCWSSALGRRH